MGQIIATVLQITAFLVSNKDSIIKLVLDIQSLIPDAAGADKAAVVKNFIGKALGIEQQLEAAWPLAKPVFDLLVAIVKGKSAA